MGEVITDENLDRIVDEIMEQARNSPDGPYITFAKYHADRGYLELKLTDGRRLLVPREELGELKQATDEQAVNLTILSHGTAIYWPDLDDGMHLYDFLEHRWRREPTQIAA